MFKTRNGSMVLLVTTLFILSGVISTAGALDRTQEKQTDTFSDNPMVKTLWGYHSIEELTQEIPTLPTDEDSGIYLVQFKGPILDEWRSELSSRGVQILGYAPDMCYIVKIEDMQMRDILGSPGVSGISHLPSGLKVSPELYEIFTSNSEVSEIMGTDQLMVDMFYPDPAVENELMTISPTVERGSSTRFVVDLPITSISDLISIPSVMWVEPKLPFMVDNNVSLAYNGVQSAWDNLGLFGSGQKVAIADTGIDTGIDNHSVVGDIKADVDNRVTVSTWAGPNGNDTHSHGTHVTGSVAGNGSLSNGSIKGMAPEAEIFFQSIANQNSGNALQLPSNLSLLFQDAYDFGARIHTNSWGANYAGAYSTNSRDVDWFLYHHPEMIILFSAGNNGRDYYNPPGTYNPDGKIDPDSIGSPASAKNCVTVGASENYRLDGGYQFQWATGSWTWKYSVDPVRTDKMSDDPTGLAAFSSRGPTDDGRLQPDVVAPGTNILSLRSSVTAATGWGLYPHNSNYLFMGGTSMSTPITAGSVVLIREFYNKSLGYGDPSGALMKATLINGALDLTPGQFGSSNATTQEINRRPDNDQGWGRIDIHNSLAPREGNNVSYIDNKVGVQTNENLTRYVKVDSEDELRLTLAWSDYPAVAWSAVNIVNDLDLVITSPNGTAYNGNDFIYPNNDNLDRTNPVEGITIPSPEKGWWKVEIKAYNIPMGPQHYALASNYELIDVSDGPDMAVYRSYISTRDDNVSVSVFNPDLIGQSSVTAQISSNSDQIGKTITLAKVGIHGQFTGYFITSNSSTTSPGHLYVSHDDTINATYNYLTYSLFEHLTAKDPVGITVHYKDVFDLVQSENETLHLEGSTQVGVDTFWRFDGLSEWAPFFDDGSPDHGDEVIFDGNVSSFWSVPGDAFGTRMLQTLVLDPYLGELFYDQFNITFNSSVPRYPKNVSGSTLETGNSVRIQWDPTDEMDIAHYSVYTNTTPPVLDSSFNGWTLVSNTSSYVTNHTLNGLVDSIDYWFRLSAVDQNGNESSLSLPFNVTPMDMEAPIIDLITTPFTIVGVANFGFTGSPDLTLVEMEYYNDTNGNGLEDDENWTSIGFGDPMNFVWDTRNSSGGPGNIDSMFLRYRGLDEVNNTSDWVVAFGFRIDNVGPSSVEILAPPPRVTNIASYPLNGRSEAFGWVQIWQNGVMDSNNSCDEFGGFSFDLELLEGSNNITLAAFDQFGAGPTSRTYWFTLDTMLPVPMIDVEDQTFIEREIGHDPYILNSSSFDQGLDENFTYIENITWTYRGPDEIAKVLFSMEFYSIAFTELGIHELSLVVRDPAGNSDEMTLQILVYDNSSPIITIDGGKNVSEDTTITYELNITDNDPRIRLRENYSISWSFTGPYDFLQNHTSEIVRIVFPEPGTYSIWIKVIDGGNNSANLTIDIEVHDITPPAGNIVGNPDVILGIPETYNANITDNGRSMGPGSTYHWSLQYLEGPPDQWWTQNFTGISFDFNFTETGAYTLILTASDPSGNERIFQINIHADGDLTPPWIAQMLPTPDASYQWSETQHFIIRFSEMMNRSSINMETVYLMDPNGSKVDVSYDIMDQDGITKVTLTPGILNFETTYTVVVGPSVQDTWENVMGTGFSANYTIRTEFKLIYPWGSTHSEVFSNITNVTKIVLRFSNPVEASSLQRWISIRALGVEKDPYSGLERQTRTLISTIITQGEDNFTVVIEADMDQGITYNLTIANEATDFFNYEIDQRYEWDFTTYIPPTTIVEIEKPDEDKGPLPEWMNDPKWFVIAAVIFVILMILLILFAGARRRRNLKRIWEAQQNESPRQRSRSEPQPQMITNEPEPSMEESEPAAMSYDDLYGAPPAGYSMGSEEIPDPVVSDPPTSDDTKGVDWDEDDDPEDWEEDEEEEWDDFDEDEDDEEVEW